jgi:hypothetical protein
LEEEIRIKLTVYQLNKREKGKILDVSRSFETYDRKMRENRGVTIE